MQEMMPLCCLMLSSPWMHLQMQTCPMWLRLSGRRSHWMTSLQEKSYRMIF